MNLPPHAPSIARIFAVVAILSAVSASAAARSFRVNDIPNGSGYGCTTCHVSAGGGGAFTGFGSDAVSALVGSGPIDQRDVDWSQLYSKDSDHDGFTNGEELGDPDGMWKIGDADPPGRHYNPGDKNDHPVGTCGDRRVTPPEECDGTNLNEYTCRGLGLDSGTLVCRADCTFDKSGCGAQGSSGSADAGAVGTGAADVGSGDPMLDPGSNGGGCTLAPGAPRSAPVSLALLAAFAFARRRRRGRDSARSSEPLG